MGGHHLLLLLTVKATQSSIPLSYYGIRKNIPDLLQVCFDEGRRREKQFLLASSFPLCKSGSVQGDSQRFFQLGGFFFFKKKASGRYVVTQVSAQPLNRSHLKPTERGER